MRTSAMTSGRRQRKAASAASGGAVVTAACDGKEVGSESMRAARNFSALAASIAAALAPVKLAPPALLPQECC